MINRYMRAPMRRLFSDAYRFELWCRVEVAVLQTQADQGQVPGWAVDPVLTAPAPTAEDVARHEERTRHDVLAFLAAWAEVTVPPGAATYVHFGMTSSDLVDTALAVQLVEASAEILTGADALVTALRQHGLAHRDTVRVGRTHGIHGEPDVWGHRVADFAFAVARSRERLRAARDGVAVAKLSGAVGTYSANGPEVEAAVAQRLGLRPADVATQVVMRDNIGAWVGALAVLATVCEAIALEIRHGQRTEVGELAEPFADGQLGSSAMPHKQNPVQAERVCGLARIVRAQIVPVLEGIPLWQERDISHSSVERIALPTAAAVTDYVVHATTALIEGLRVDRAAMVANLARTDGLIFSSAALRALIAAGVQRATAYATVRAAADRTRAGEGSFRDMIGDEAARAGLPVTGSDLDELCRPETHLTRLGPIFDRLAALT